MSIYFIQELDTGFIKLGNSVNPEKRLYAISYSMGKKMKDFKILKVVDGDCNTEYFYQCLLEGNYVPRKIGGCNSREWFKPSDKVLALVNKSPEWFARIYKQSLDLRIKYGKNVSFSFDGTNVRCKIKK